MPTWQRSSSSCILLASALNLIASSAVAATCHEYIIIIDSKVSGNFGSAQNQVEQIAIFRDEGARSNPFEFLIRYPGDMNALNVRPGAIELMTNSGWARNPGMASARFDLAATQRQGDTYRFQLEQSSAFQMPPPNVIAVPGPGQSSGGLGGECYVPGLQGLCEQMRNSSVLSTTYLVPGKGGGSFRLNNQF